MYRADDVLRMAQGILENWFSFTSSPSGKDWEECVFCREDQNSVDRKKYVVGVHLKDCPVLVAKDVITGHDIDVKFQDY